MSRILINKGKAMTFITILVTYGYFSRIDINNNINKCA